MNQVLKSAQLRQTNDLQLQQRLLAELEGLFREIEDGTVQENSFTGCTALGHGSLPPLDENQSRQIKEALYRTTVAADQSAKASKPILSSMFDLLRGLWRSHDSKALPAQDNAKSDSAFLDQYGRVMSKDTSPAGGDRNGQVGSLGILETDVKQFMAAQPEDYTWVMPYAWDIANRLNAVKQSETDGDVALFLERRRKLNVRRPKATRFEQSVQRYAASISEVYCDDHGDIVDEKSLETFIRALVATLLDKSKTYWPTTPLLAIFDGLVVTVMRPLLHKHHTAFIESEVTSATGVVMSGNTAGKVEKLVTAPKWNERSHRLVMRYVKKAFKAEVWSLFLDRYAPYNRDYARSPHLNAATLTDVGYLTKGFGNPVHLNKVMELLQPTHREDDLVQYVDGHFRSDDFIDH